MVACLILVASLALLLINPWKFSDYAIVANQTGFTMLHQNLSSFVLSEIDVDFNHKKGNSSVEIYAVPWKNISVLHETVHNHIKCSTFPCVISKYLYVVRSEQTDLNYTIKMVSKSNNSDLQLCISIFDDETKYNYFLSNQTYQPAKSKIFNKSNSESFFFRLCGADMKMPAAYYFIVVHFAYPSDYLSSIHDKGVQVEVSVNASIGYYMLPSNTKPALNKSSKVQSFHLHNGRNCILAKYNDSTVAHINIKNGNLIRATLGIVLSSIAMTAALLIVLTISIALCLNHYFSKRKIHQKSLLHSNSISQNNQSFPNFTQQRLHNYITKSQGSNEGNDDYR